MATSESTTNTRSTAVVEVPGRIQATEEELGQMGRLAIHHHRLVSLTSRLAEPSRKSKDAESHETGTVNHVPSRRHPSARTRSNQGEAILATNVRVLTGHEEMAAIAIVNVSEG